MPKCKVDEGVHREKQMTNERLGFRLTVHHLSLELSCIASPYQRAMTEGEQIPVLKSCQALVRIRQYTKTSALNKRLGLGYYQIEST